MPRKLVVGALLGVLAAGLTGGGAAHARDKTTVVTGFYPLAYAAEQVGGGRVQVTNLTPAGAEPHDLELSPDQMDTLLDADVVVVMGRGFQPAVERAAGERDGPTVKLLDRLPIHAGHGALDPHVWLDPVLMQDIVRETRTALTKADPRGRATYARNARALITELTTLDDRYRRGLAQCDRHLIVTAHEAFGYLARRYGLAQQGVAGISPDAEPDPKRLAELTDLVKKEHVTTVFTETLLSPRIADTLAREAGVKAETLDPLEGLSRQRLRAGADYLSVMDANLVKLRAALGCP